MALQKKIQGATAPEVWQRMLSTLLLLNRTAILANKREQSAKAA